MLFRQLQLFQPALLLMMFKQVFHILLFFPPSGLLVDDRNDM